MPTARALAGGDRLTALDRLQVPRSGHRDRHRKDGAQAVDDVEPEESRDAQPIAFDREPLQSIDLGGIGLEQK
jgi:hypothetical protein